MKYLSECPNSKKTTLFWQIPGYAPILLMTYLRIALRKNWFIDYLVEYFKEIIKMLNASIFSFIILNLVKKGILDFHVTVLVQHFEGKSENHWKHERSGLHLNHLGSPILTVNFLNVLNSLDSEQWLKSKG